MWVDFHSTPYVAGKKQYFWGTNYNGDEINDTLEVCVKNRGKLMC